MDINNYCKTCIEKSCKQLAFVKVVYCPNYSAKPGYQKDRKPGDKRASYNDEVVRGWEPLVVHQLIEYLGSSGNLIAILRSI